MVTLRIMKLFEDLHIHIHLASMDPVTNALANIQTSISSLGTTLMATLESIQAANTQLIADVAEEKAEVAAKLNTVATSLSTLEATIVTLQAQIAANAGSATPEQLDGVLDGIQSAGRAVRDIYTPAPVVPA